MSEIAKTIGQRVRNYRIDKGLSQEKLAELSGCHPTYIGQVERGEKNATLESIEKIASAMNCFLEVKPFFLLIHRQFSSRPTRHIR